jgi:aspartate kinase
MSESLCVYKFGGASLKDSEGFIRAKSIIETALHHSKLLIVVSAAGKSTNALEEILNTHKAGKEVNDLISQVILLYSNIFRDLFPEAVSMEYEEKRKAELLFSLESAVRMPFDEGYDFFIGIGERFSAMLMAEWLTKSISGTHYIPSERWLRTDERFREARVMLEKSQNALHSEIETKPGRLWITEGFTGLSETGKPTTLGREGSDYTAAIAGWCTDASAVYIWKDVPGVLNADPKLFSNAIPIAGLTYNEAVELAYYGASVMHPRTLLPLRKKGIPLYVKSFITPGISGTVIDDVVHPAHAPAVIIKSNQQCYHIRPKEPDFVMEAYMGTLFRILESCRIRVNLIQHSALTLLISVDSDRMREHAFQDALAGDFEWERTPGLALVTIRRYTQEVIDELLGGKPPVVLQKHGLTARFLIAQPEAWNVRQWS